MAKKVLFPTYQMAAGRRMPYRRYLLEYPMSLVKIDGVWTEIVTPSADLLEAVGVGNYFIGGYTYVLTDAQIADLPSQYQVDV